MASLDRAYGLRGGLIAVGIAGFAGMVQGVLVATDPVLVARIGLALASFLVLLLAGVVSARRGRASAIGCALAMLLAFSLTRWACWVLMVAGPDGLAALAQTPPWAWPAALAGFGAGSLALVELATMATAALGGCLAGHERQD